MESYVESNYYYEVEEPRCITRRIKIGNFFEHIDNIHGSTAQVRKTNKTNKLHTLIRGRSKKLKVESPTQSILRKSMRLQRS